MTYILFFTHPNSFVKYFILIDTYRGTRRVSSVLDLLVFQLDAGCRRASHTQNKKTLGRVVRCALFVLYDACIARTNLILLYISTYSLTMPSPQSLPYSSKCVVYEYKIIYYYVFHILANY